ncbi:MAG: sulfurtransferase complex subunit TusB [Burkholderiales bacterium]|nr:sulfurtransferase complex subunit TusB [Burkholderiales bacterium]
MLHIINKSPLSSCALESCLRIAQGGDILLIEDAVYAAASGSALEDKIREAMGRFRVHALMPDIDARGFSERVIEGVSKVDYGGFVDLVAANENCQSWL